MAAQLQEVAHVPEQVERGVLRVLCGPQAGAEIALCDGTYVVGNADSCDIVLFDDDVAGTHLEITVSQDNIGVDARDGAVAFVDGTLASGEGRILDVAEALTLGSTSLGIGQRDTDWSTLTIPDAPAVAEAAVPDGGAEVRTDEAGMRPADEARKKESSDQAPAPVLRARFNARRWLWLPAAIALIIVPAGIRFYTEDSATTTATSPATAPDPAALAARASDIVAELDLQEVGVQSDADGNVEITGYVPDDAKHAALRTALNKAGIVYVDRLRMADKLVVQARTTLAAFSWPSPGFGDHLQVSYGSYGSIVIDGYLGPEVDRDTLRRQVLADAPGITRLRFRQADIGFWQEKLNRQLSDAGLARWLSTEAKLGEITVKGELTEVEAREWREVGEAFTKESRGWPKLDIEVRLVRSREAPAQTPVKAATPVPVSPSAAEPIVPAAPVSKAPEITVVGTVTSNSGFKRALLSDGVTLAEGDTVENEFTVAEIHSDRIVLRAQGRSFTYHVKEAK